MKPKMLFVQVALLIISICWPQSEAYSQTDPDKEITTLLNAFLDSVSYPQMHERFWADDLIYTSSAGKRFGKEAIVGGMEPPTAEQLANAPAYRAEDIVIRTFNGTGVLTFTLVSQTDEETTRYLNSGVLVLRNNRWRVVNWQATKMSE